MDNKGNRSERLNTGVRGKLSFGELRGGFTKVVRDENGEIDWKETELNEHTCGDYLGRDLSEDQIDRFLTLYHDFANDVADVEVDEELDNIKKDEEVRTLTKDYQNKLKMLLSQFDRDSDIVSLSNAEIANLNKFKEFCKHKGIEPSTRQVSKHKEEFIKWYNSNLR